MRLDVFLAEQGLARSRTHAASLIADGRVTVNGLASLKPSVNVTENDTVSVREDRDGYVSRGGLKLEAALETFGISPEGLVCADIGASTGGFTDCLLRHGAAKVYAVDSGHGQLDPKIAADGRVVSLEGVNARYMTCETLGERCSLVTCDVSFISQTLIIPKIAEILETGGTYVGLVKPQFEAGREALGKNGVVRDPRHHVAALEKVAGCLAENGMEITGIVRSPIKGGEGNTEFLVAAVNGAQDAPAAGDSIAAMIGKAVRGSGRTGDGK